jgi:hypothetical protein
VTNDQHEHVKESFDWTEQTQELLNKLLRALWKQIDVWRKFNAPNGGIRFLPGLDSMQGVVDGRSHPSYGSIKETYAEINDKFEYLESHRQKLDHLRESCHDLAKRVSLPPSSLLLESSLTRSARTPVEASKQ